MTSTAITRLPHRGTTARAPRQRPDHAAPRNPRPQGTCSCLRPVAVRHRPSPSTVDGYVAGRWDETGGSPTRYGGAWAGARFHPELLGGPRGSAEHSRDRQSADRPERAGYRRCRRRRTGALRCGLSVDPSRPAATPPGSYHENGRPWDLVIMGEEAPVAAVEVTTDTGPSRNTWSPRGGTSRGQRSLQPGRHEAARPHPDRLRRPPAMGRRDQAWAASQRTMSAKRLISSRSSVPGPRISSSAPRASNCLTASRSDSASVCTLPTTMSWNSPVAA
ncbi:hypothetical protein UA75_03400 [Actinoalloteichus sp. GBA129-24]|nr:hypothetical protein UA75_03400 [Actinoalloteichus sp. GBA129-24]